MEGRSLRLRCGRCQKWLVVPSRLAGQTVHCPDPACRTEIHVSDEPEGQQEPPPEPPDAAPPPGAGRTNAVPAAAAAMLRRERLKFQWTTLGTFLLAAGVLAFFAVFDRRDLLAGSILGGIIAFAGLVFAVALGAQYWRVRSRVAIFISGDYVAHWTYSPEEWRVVDPKWEHGDPVGEVYIGKRSALVGDGFVEWNVLGCVLEHVELEDGPPAALQLLLRYHNPQTGNVFQVVRIPVPAGREAEARHVLRTLTQIQKQSGGIRAIHVVVSLLLFVMSLAVALLYLFGK